MNILTSDDFKTVSKETLLFLNDKLGFELWLVAFYQKSDFQILQSVGSCSNITNDNNLEVSEYFHASALNDRKIHIVPNLKNIPDSDRYFAHSNINIGAYISAPLFDLDGKVMGSLSAIDSNPQPENIKDSARLLKVFSYLLSATLNQHLKAYKAIEDNAKLLIDANTDSLTNLFNRRAWDQAVLREEERCSRYGNSAGVLIIDLDGLKTVNDKEGHAAGDKLICKAGVAIQSAVRDGDVVARVGGDEFTVLAVECNIQETEITAKRINKALTRAGVEASIGWAVRKPNGKLLSAQHRADHMLYQNKRKRNAIS